MQKIEYLNKFWPLYLLSMLVMLLLSLGASKAATAFSENQPIYQKHTIVIDAGHGGEDGGATSVSGILESQINLQIALRLDDLLHLLGYQTRMVRTTDISVYTEGNSLSEKKISDLKQRVKIVNNTENSILISIHQNTFSDSQYSGAQVFYSANAESHVFATRMQNQLIAACNPGSTRKEKPADGIYLMQHIQNPGILIECSFISNHQEEAKIQTVNYQERLCSVIASVLTEFILSTESSA